MNNNLSNINDNIFNLIKEHENQEMIFNKLRKNSMIDYNTIKYIRVQYNNNKKRELIDILHRNLKRKVNLN